MTNRSGHSYKHAEHWDELLTREFEKESDRAAVALLSEEDARGLVPVRTLEFATMAERDTYLVQKYGIKTAKEK